MLYTRENAPAVETPAAPETETHLRRVLALDRAADLRRALPAGWRVWVGGATLHVTNPAGVQVR